MRAELVGEVGRRSLGEFAARRLAPLARALDLDEQQVLSMLERLSQPWAAQSLDRPLGWRSRVGDDHTPIELSIAFGRVRADHELRIMVEPLASEPSLTDNARATAALLDSLAGEHDIELGNLRRVADLFWPERPEGVFAAWLAAGISSSGRWSFKIYLNPAVLGLNRARAVVEEALTRLGFSRSWPVIADHLLTRELDRLEYFALDLSGGAAARVKVYAKHFRAEPGLLDTAAAPALHFVRNDPSRFLGLVAPEVSTEFSGRGLFTCYSFVASNDAPTTSTTHFPINGYVSSDRVASERIQRVLNEYGLDTDAYRRALAAHATRPLEAGLGLHSYASFRRDAGGPRLTIYLPLEAYEPGRVAPADIPEAPGRPSDMVELYERQSPITDHPFLARLRREPVDLGKLWLVLHNFQTSISKNFARNLARVLARIEDNRVRCILAEQLAQELGNGSWDQAHLNLFIRMMERLAPYAPAPLEARHSLPGRGFDQRLSLVYDHPDPNVGLGAIILGEVFGKQIDQYLAAEFRRQSEVDTESLEWLVLHEQLEVDHADDSAELSTLIPEAAYAAVVAGGADTARAGYRFLDDLYALCYGLPDAEMRSAAE